MTSSRALTATQRAVLTRLQSKGAVYAKHPARGRVGYSRTFNRATLDALVVAGFAVWCTEPDGREFIIPRPDAEGTA